MSGARAGPMRPAKNTLINTLIKNTLINTLTEIIEGEGLALMAAERQTQVILI